MCALNASDPLYNYHKSGSLLFNAVIRIYYIIMILKCEHGVQHDLLVAQFVQQNKQPLTNLPRVSLLTWHVRTLDTSKR